MRAIVTMFVMLALGVALACDDAPSPTPTTPSLHAKQGDVIALLPDRTLAVVEFHDLAARWEELRGIEPLARAQDRLLAGIGLDAEDVEEIAGGGLVLALVADPDWREVVPLAVLDPHSHERALARLGRSGSLLGIERRGAVWVGAPGHTRLVQRISEGDGTSLRQVVDFTELDERLRQDALVRVTLNPPALVQMLRVRGKLAGSALTTGLAALLRAHLEAIETVGFTRDVAAGEIVTDGWVGFDPEAVPEAFRRMLETRRGTARLPGDLSADVLLAGSFRIDAEAGLAYLRSMAARDPRGPLRNLEFWIAEFEARSGRDVERDVVGALEDRSIAFVLEAEDGAGIEVVTILEARDPARLEAALVDLAGWLAEHVQGRSLGLTIPRLLDTESERGVVHGMRVWTPLGAVGGPAFQIVGDRLVLASSRRGLRRGLELAESAGSWSTPTWALDGVGAPDEIAWIRTPALAGALGLGSDGKTTYGSSMLDAGFELLEASVEGRIAVRYEEYGVHLYGRLIING